MFGLITGALGALGGMSTGAAAALGAGASLIGGAADRKQRNEELAMQDPAYIRDRAEASGFNPLLFTQNAFQGLGYAPSFGSSIADAGAILANANHQEKQLELQKSELELENRRLDELVKANTLRARVPGIYGNGRQGTSGIFPASSEGLPSDTSSRVRGGAGTRPNLSVREADMNPFVGVNSIAPLRDKDVTPLMNQPGVFEVQSGLTAHQPFTFLGSEGEFLGLDELIVAAPQWAAQMGWKLSQDYRAGNLPPPYISKPSKSQNFFELGPKGNPWFAVGRVPNPNARPYVPRSQRPVQNFPVSP